MSATAEGMTATALGHAPKMLSVHVKEFTLSTTWEHKLPVPFNKDHLQTVVLEICASPLIGPFVVAQETNVTNQNDLFAYSATIPLFNHAGVIKFSAQNITVDFKQGRTKGHLIVMLDVMLKALEIAKPPDIKRTIFNHVMHAAFDSEGDYLSYMKRFASAELNVRSGGVLWLLEIPEITGEMRYATEKSLSYANGLFLSVSGFHAGASSKEVIQCVNDRLERVAKRDQVQIILDEN